MKSLGKYLLNINILLTTGKKVGVTRNKILLVIKDPSLDPLLLVELTQAGCYQTDLLSVEPFRRFSTAPETLN